MLKDYGRCICGNCAPINGRGKIFCTMCGKFKTPMERFAAIVPRKRGQMRLYG